MGALLDPRRHIVEHKFRGVLHADVGQNTKFDNFLLMHPFKQCELRVVCVDQTGVVKLVFEPVFDRAKATEVDAKALGRQVFAAELEDEAAAVSMDKFAMPLMSPLAMRAGVIGKDFSGDEHAHARQYSERHLPLIPVPP